MSKEGIIEMVIRELTEKILEDRRENLSEEEQQTLDDYFVKTNLIADKECAFLYVHGAKDCVELLKRLGAL
ncbi:MAG TPA: hypothetical protein VN258_14285 [Mobilitalea sp.]|nr:hypothetical protein [Mobilitalea sp.]